MTTRKQRSVSKRLDMLEMVEMKHTKMLLENRSMLNALLAEMGEERRDDIMRRAGEELNNLLSTET